MLKFVFVVFLLSFVVNDLRFYAHFLKAYLKLSGCLNCLCSRMWYILYTFFWKSYHKVFLTLRMAVIWSNFKNEHILNQGEIHVSLFTTCASLLQKTIILFKHCVIHFIVKIICCQQTHTHNCTNQNVNFACTRQSCLSTNLISTAALAIYIEGFIFAHHWYVEFQNSSTE